MKHLKDLLSDLRSEGIKVWAEGERLRFSGPKGAITDEIRSELASRKPELLEFFANATRALSETLPVITPIERSHSLPLSFAQERVWFLDQLEGKSPEYNIPAALKLEGPLDVDALRRALDEIIRRHEVLRAFFPTENGKVAQVIAPSVKLAMPVIDLTHLPESARRAASSKLADEEAQIPFDLASGPMIRAQLLRLGPESHVLLLTKHHIVSDGWSLGVLFSELGSVYGAMSQGSVSPLEDLRIQYADFASWQREWLAKGELERQLNYWKQKLSGAPALLKLPTDRPRPRIQGFRGSMEHFEVDAALARGLKKVSEQSGATLYMTLLAAFVALLSRYSGERDIVVGTPIANRNLSEVESLIGFFVNTLLMRTQLTREMTFAELLKQVRQVSLDAYAHQDLPFEKLVAELQPERNLSYSPLFQVMFIMQNAPMGRPELPGLRETTLQMDVNVVRCDLTLSMEESADSLKGLLTYKPELFDASTIERFSRRYQRLLQSIVARPDALLRTLDVDDQIALPPIPELDKAVTEEPLSYHQERMWFIDRFETGTVYATSPVYHNLPLILHFDQAVDKSQLESSLNVVVARHEALRTQIGSDGDRLFQTVLPAYTLRLETEVVSEEASDDVAISKAIAETQRPFVLEGVPPVRARLIERQSGGSLFVLTIHHILADQESLNLIAREIGAVYSELKRGGTPALSPAAVQYRQVARGERLLDAEAREALLLYWREQLRGRLEALELPVDRARPHVHTYTAGTKTAVLDHDLSERLQTLSRITGSSLDAVLLTAFNVLLHRYANQSEVLVGISDTGRNWNEPGQTIGPIANLLTLRNDLGGNPSFEKSLADITRTAELAGRHRSMPFDLLVREINPEKDMSRTALFDVLFQFHQKETREDISFGAASATLINTNLGHGKYDLNLALYETAAGIEGILTYNRDFFDEFTVEQMLRHYLAILNAVSANSRVAVDDITLLSADEQRLQITGFNATNANFPADRTIHELFAERVALAPEAIAVVCGGESVSYAELDSRANQLANVLLSHGVKGQDLIALCLDRSVEMIVAMLGVLKAGAAYLPLDPAHPSDRLKFMIEDSATKHLVTAGTMAVPEFGGQVIRVDGDDVRSASVAAPPMAGAARDLAYCIYTSGSTGLPKGVLIEHRNVVRLIVNDKLQFDFRDSDVWTMFHSYCFDFSVWEVFGALLHGARLIVVPSEVTRDPALVLGLLAEQKVTVLNQTPAAFYALSREAMSGVRPELALRYVIFGGEALQPIQLREWRNAYPEVALINMYGITETTVHVTFKQITDQEIDANIGNIGVPIPTLTTYVMDEHLRLLPIGVPGEICVGGLGVARGYLNRDELTSEKFVENPYVAGERLYRSGDLARLRSNGEMLYIGRRDNQVQIRGYRVEPGEVQDRLLAHPLVAEAIVVPRSAGETVELVAYILPKAGTNSKTAKSNGSASDRARRYQLPNGMEIFHLNRNETEFLYQEIFAEASYLQHGVTLRDGDCVFDIGANIGLFTLFAGHACRNPRIYSFEPIPATFDVLKRNAELYGLNAKVFQCGLGRASEEVTFTYYPYVTIFSGRFAVPEEEQKIIKSFVMHQQQDAPLSALESAEIDELLAERMGTQEVVCQLRSLSEIIRTENVGRIDLLKIDVEKGEIDMLAGIDDADWDKIQQIVMEVHNVDQRLEHIRALMESHGFEVEIDQEDWSSETTNHNLFAVKPARKLLNSERSFEILPTLPIASGGHVVDELRRHLKQTLPDYMIPSSFVVLESVPRTVNGKVDLRNLPAPDQTSRPRERELIAPRTPLEAQILEIWRTVLGVDEIGVEDSFFEVGGHSLLATQVISRLRDAASVSLPVRVLFESPTIAALAEAVEAASLAQQQNEGPALVKRSREAKSRSSLGLRGD